MSDYVLYRGSRDELNEMCRQKDEQIGMLVAELQKLILAIDQYRAVTGVEDLGLNLGAADAERFIANLSHINSNGEGRK